MWPSSSPDITIVIGECTFLAHMNVLGLHSGYFNALLSSTKLQMPHPVIALPNMDARDFAVLLRYLYEGHLQVNLSNIHSVLLAAQYLNIPTAFLACKYFLEQSDSLSNRLFIPFDGPSKPIEKWARYASEPETQKKLPIRPIPIMPSTSKAAESVSKPDDTEQKKNEDRDTRKKLLTFLSGGNERKQKGDNLKDWIIDASMSKSETIYDVATCDGPVHFQRILNSNYDTEMGGDSNNPNRCTEPIKKGEETQENTSNFVPEAPNSKDSFTKSAVSSRDLGTTENVHGPEDKPENMESSQCHSQAVADKRIYNCKYCNHTFKSYYCYEKHKKRHLSSIGAKMHERSSTDDSEKTQTKPNITFYPCKMCGSRFPSYYFVHKHRKFCTGQIRPTTKG